MHGLNNYVDTKAFVFFCLKPRIKINKRNSVPVENMKTDHFMIYITTTIPTELSWFCHIFTHITHTDEAQSRKNFQLVWVGFQKCYQLVDNALPSV
jgi:hypothetical protein